MAVTRLNNIKTNMLRWAFERAGLGEEDAIKAFPLLEAWLSNEQKPTIAQLQKFAAKFYVPQGYLFMNTIPDESIPFPMFRGDAALANHFDLNVYDTVMNVSSRQEWLEEYLQEIGIAKCPLVNSVKLNTPIIETVVLLRNTLQLEAGWNIDTPSTDAALNILTEKLEEAGVFIAYNGVVGNNTHRPLKVSECRGFALVNKVAPYIFINSADSKNAQLFTLVHEAAHIMLGISAGHAGEDMAIHNYEEKYCDMVAAEFLVPADVLRQQWSKNIKNVSRKFKVSEIVIARRAHDLNILSDEDYRLFWMEYSQRTISIKKNSGGGSFYKTSIKRVGRLFAIHVRNAVNNRQLNYTDAYRLTGLHGDTYQHFMKNNI